MTKTKSANTKSTSSTNAKNKQKTIAKTTPPVTTKTELHRKKFKPEILALCIAGVVLIIALVITLAFIVVSSTTSTDAEEDSSSLNPEDNIEDSENVGGLNYEVAQEFDDGYAVLTKNDTQDHIYYVIDDNFQARFAYDGNATVASGFIDYNRNAEREHRIINPNGEVVYEYTDDGYTTVKLLPNGYAIIAKQVDTYNSSEEKTGIYNLNTKAYALEPNVKYNDRIKAAGSKMLVIDDNGKEDKYFNLDIGKLIEFTPPKYSLNFTDNFAMVDINNETNELIYKVINGLDGKIADMKAPEAIDSGALTPKNGMFFSDTCEQGDNGKLKCYNAIYNLKTGEIIDLTKQFTSVIINQPEFNNHGYALVHFNNQGNRPYYTVINQKGEMQFDPVPVKNDNNNETLELVSENLINDNDYFLVNNNGTSELRDKNNKIVLKNARENDVYEKLTKNAIIVRRTTLEQPDEMLYVDFNGNDIKITIPGNLPIYK